MEALNLYKSAEEGLIFSPARFNLDQKAIEDAINKLTQSTAEGDSGASNIKASKINGLNGNDVQALLLALKDYIDKHMGNTFNPHTVTAAQLGVYTKNELDPYLRGGDTVIKYEVFTIVNSNNGNGTFTYKNTDNTIITGNLTPEGYQIFELKNGKYQLGQNRIECTINDILQRSVASGGLSEMDETHVALTQPEGSGAEVTIKYFEKVGVTGTGLIVMGENNPGSGFFWFKVVG